MSTILDKENARLMGRQGLLGHDDARTTLDTYTHEVAEAKREAAQVLEQVVFADRDPLELLGITSVSPTERKENEGPIN